MDNTEVKDKTHGAVELIDVRSGVERASDAGAGVERDPAGARLVERCLRGERRAYGEIYDRHTRELYRHLEVLLGFSADVEDTLQRVFQIAFDKLDRYDSQRAKLSTWLHGIAVRVALNARRQELRRGAALQVFARDDGVARPRRPTDPHARAESAQALVDLYRHLDKVAPKKRTAFLLYFVEDLELGEVAAQLGTTPAAAWARIERARSEVLRSIERQRLAAERREGRRT